MRQRWQRAGLAALAFAFLGGAPAMSADPADMAYWTSVRDSNNPAEIQAYLQAFPRGQFAALARVRLSEMHGGAPAANPPAAPVAQSGMPAIVPVKTTYRIIDRIVAKVDSRGFPRATNFRLSIVAAGTPDAVSDPAAFADNSTAVPAPISRMNIPPGPPGKDELRLYYVPQFATTYSVGARVPIEVTPGVAGATEIAELTKEIDKHGPVWFAFRYNTAPVKIEGQFIGSDMVDKQNPVIALGYPEVIPDMQDPNRPPTQIHCVLAVDAKDKTTMARVAAMKNGDAVLITGDGLSWSTGDHDGMIVQNCKLAK